MPSAAPHIPWTWEERDAMTSSPTIEGITHHTAVVNGTELHYVAAGATGSLILLVHGFPETWWAFHKIIPLLTATHRVFAVERFRRLEERRRRPVPWPYRYSRSVRVAVPSPRRLSPRSPTAT